MSPEDIEDEISKDRLREGLDEPDDDWRNPFGYDEVASGVDIPGIAVATEDIIGLVPRAWEPEADEAYQSLLRTGREARRSMEQTIDQAPDAALAIALEW